MSAPVADLGWPSRLRNAPQQPRSQATIERPSTPPTAPAARCLVRFESLMDDLVEQSRPERWADPVGTPFDACTDRCRTDAGPRAICHVASITERFTPA